MIRWSSSRLAAAIVLFAASTCVAQDSSKSTKDKHYIVYIGTYTGPNSKGIYAYRFDTAKGTLEPIGVAGETPNPSFVAIHPSKKYLLAANETGKGSVTSFSIDHATGKLTQINQVSAHGAGTCYVNIDKSGKNAFVANYSSGSFAVVPIGADGRLSEASSVIQDTGSGANKQRQEGPHAHSLNPSPDDRYAIGADLGLDKLFIFKLNPNSGRLTPNDPPFTQLKPESGPRHFTFHPNGKFAYNINEMASTVGAFAWDAAKGTLTQLQTVSTLPADFHGQNTTAEVRVDPAGRFLYGSNRGHDSIAVFKIDPAKGTLTFVEDVPTQGKTPRNFAMDPTGRYLIAANQDSNNLVVFRVDRATGKLTATGQSVSVSRPVCVRYLELD